MNRCTTVLMLAVWVLCSCSNPARQQQHKIVLSNDIFLKETADSTKSTLQILDQFSESVLALAQADTAAVYYGSNILDEANISRQMLVGKFIDG